MTGRNPAEGTLPGTAPLIATWQQAFRDRYPDQYAQTIAWLRRALADASQRRDQHRQGDHAWLDRQRSQLARLSGAAWAPGEIVDASFSSASDGQRMYSVRVQPDVIFTGVWAEPAGPEPRGVVVLGRERADDRAALAERYRDAGLRVVQPFFARPLQSFRTDPQRKWYSFGDDELLHLFSLIIGGSLAGLEAMEVVTIARLLAMTELGRPVPIILDLGDRWTLTGVIAAALNPGLVARLVLHDEVRFLDHQEDDQRINTIWSFHAYFDALTLFALAAPTDLLFVERSVTPSPTVARAMAWHSASSGHPTLPTARSTVRRVFVPDGADPMGYVATAVSDLPAPARDDCAISPRLPREVSTGAAPDDLYRHVVTSKLAFLEAAHLEARHRRQERYDLRQITLEQYRYRVGESLARVMGPALPEAGDHRPRTRLAVRRPTHAVYEVVLESVPGLDVAGYLLVPAAETPAPAVICQHGLSGRPEYLAGLEDSWIYDRVAQRLTEKGYVTFVPFMNWGWGGTPARDLLVKHAYALGITPNRFEVAQLHAIVDFLQSRPEVIAERIAFYGLSYGGHASIWLGANESRLAAVVTAGHFNDWQSKLTSTEIAPPCSRPTAYVTVDEGYDMFTYNILNEVNHAEMVTRFAPRPYLVENGLRDTVTPTAWVEREFQRAQAVFSTASASQQIELESFDGPHRIWSEGSFRFLHRHLKGRADATSSS